MFHLSFFLHFWHLVYDNLRAEETYSGLEQTFMFPCILFPTVTKKRCLEKTVAIEEAWMFLEYLGPRHYPSLLKVCVRIFEVYLLQYGTLPLYKVMLDLSLSFLTRNSIL